METIKITKMHGCGNDFVFLDYEEFQKSGKTLEELAKQLCDRHYGVGADGMIIPVPYEGEDADIAWHYYNSDGTTAQMCGNGMRCFAKYVFDRNLVSDKQFRVKTLAGIIQPKIMANGLVKVNMGNPILEKEKIPFSAPSTSWSGFCEVKNENYKITVKGKTFKITPVSMGNPHCVIFVKDNPHEYAKIYGSEIEKHRYFPEKTNVEFVKIISKNEVEMCVYERGCGITLACGTGACATVVACVLNNLTEGKVKVNLQGGSVNIDWKGSKEDPEKNISLTGPAQYVFYADFML